MIIRKFQLLVAAHLICTSIAQNERSYDTNDWIPITQSNEESATPKKPTGRVLNLDAPAQKFFPDEFLYKKSRPNFQSRPKHKDRYNIPKYENAYKFELPPSLPQNVQQMSKFQFQYPQEVQLPNYQQPPALEVYRPPPPRIQYMPSPQAIQAPPPNQPSTYQQYNQFPVLPPVAQQPALSAYNTTYYQTISPLSINQELVDNIQYQNLQGVPEKQSLQNLQNTEGGVNPSDKINNGNDNVQLVYVPLENLKGNQQVQPLPQDTQNIYRQVESPRYENPLDKPQRLAVIEQDFIQQALQATKLQEQIQQGEPLLFQISTTTTPKPIKKRKPHQPPLAVYLEEDKKRQADVTDVLSVLQDAKSIAVQDFIQPGSPQIFIGPSTLDSPDYTKFPLPYLNTIDGNRINRKVDSLPFFVAPLSFKTPPGYSKIPLPAPHIGSVVISNKEDLHGKRSTPRPNQYHSESTKFVKDEAAQVTQNPEILTQQPYFGQTYYEQIPIVSSPQPQYDNQNKQYGLSSDRFNAQIVGNEYNLPLKSQLKETTEVKSSEVVSNTKPLPQPTFHYSYVDEDAKTSTRNYYNKPKLTEEVNYNTPSKSLSYTGPQTYEEEEDKRPYQQEYTDFSSTQKENEEQYRIGGIQQVRYEPISTTFDTNPRPPQDVVNIKPKTETSHRPKVSSYLEEEQQKPRLQEISPLELAINEFELHQINTQLEEKPRVKNQYNYKGQSTIQDSNEDTQYKFDPELHRFSSTPASILRDTYETTTRPTTKSRNRIKTRSKTTTLPPPEVETYTVLEEFSAKQKPQKNEHSSFQYTSQSENSEAEPVTSQQKYVNPSYSTSVTEIENIPTKVYSIKANKNSPIYTEAPSIDHSYTLNQNLMDQQILQSGIQQSPNYEQQGQFEVDPHQYTIQPNIESTRGQLLEYTQENTNDYTSSLDDPSVRTLLIPKLLVPTTTNEVYTGPTYLPTTEKIRSTTTTTTSTTETPIEITTHTRIRTRTRGGNRFNNHSTTKRPVTRRRSSSRVTTERPIKYIQDSDQNTKNTNVKTRFRTRGRTTPNSITERQSTTENEIHDVSTPESTINIRTHPDGSESYMQYEYNVNPQKVTTVEREEPDFSKVYSSTSRPILQYDNTASSLKPNINVQVTHPEEILKDKVRVRGRVRDRPKGTTSTEKLVTRRITNKPSSEKEDSGEELYGFFRTPDFGPPAETRVEVPTTTPRHRIYSYQTPSQHGEDYHLNIDNTHLETSTVRFIGEIVPKYTTSKEVITETETPKPRIRTRTRTPQRKSQTSDIQEQSTRRTNIIRSRGKTHFKVPQNFKKDKDDDDDVEGGNYPAQFLQGRRATTPSPNFQITVAPEDEDDQDLNPSLYRPNVVASPEEWHDVSEFEPAGAKNTDSNILEGEEKSSLTDDQPQQPYALPVKAITEKLIETTPKSSSNSEELFNETTKSIEEQFEAINNFDNENKNEENTKKATQQKRKGVWKLVKHRPLDHLETSESQNYLSVLNSFHDIQKVNMKENDLSNQQKPVIEDSNKPSFAEEIKNFQDGDLDEISENNKVKPIEITTTLPDEESITTIHFEESFSTAAATTLISKEQKEEDFLDSIYEMFGMSRQNEEQSTPFPSLELTTSPVTTTLNPTFPDELTEFPSSSSKPNTTEVPLDIETTTNFPDDFTTPQLEAKYEIKTSTFSVLPSEVKEVKTSTSTEVSHETEICYRGRCIRSHDAKKKL